MLQQLDTSHDSNHLSEARHNQGQSLVAAIPPRSRPSQTLERVFGTLAVLDQAVLGLQHANRGFSSAELPRSLLLSIFHTYNQFGSQTGTLANMRLIGQAGSCVSQLARSWNTALTPRRHEHMAKPVARYYTLATLAVATVVIPWLLLRKRPERGYLRSTENSRKTAF